MSRRLARLTEEVVTYEHQDGVPKWRVAGHLDDGSALDAVVEAEDGDAARRHPIAYARRMTTGLRGASGVRTRREISRPDLEGVPCAFQSPSYACDTCFSESARGARRGGLMTAVISRPIAPGHGPDKYSGLTRLLTETSEDSLTLGFGEIEAALGLRWPASAWRHQAWWSNTEKGHSHARACFAVAGERAGSRWPRSASPSSVRPRRRAARARLVRLSKRDLGARSPAAMPRPRRK